MNIRFSKYHRGNYHFNLIEEAIFHLFGILLFLLNGIDKLIKKDFRKYKEYFLNFVTNRHFNSFI